MLFPLWQVKMSAVNRVFRKLVPQLGSRQTKSCPPCLVLILRTLRNLSQMTCTVWIICIVWVNLGSCHPCGCYLTCTTYLSIVADHVHPFVASFGRIMRCATEQKWFTNGLRGATISLRCWLGLQIYQISVQSNICEMCWTNKSDPWSPCLDRSGLFWQHKGDQHNIRQVVIMLCLISVSGGWSSGWGHTGPMMTPEPVLLIACWEHTESLLPQQQVVLSLRLLLHLCYFFFYSSNS